MGPGAHAMVDGDPRAVKAPEPIKGTDLRLMFERLSPFGKDLRLKPEDEQRSILAVNGNYPLELQLPAFFHAATLEGGSPLIVQISGAGLKMLGKGLKPKSVPAVHDTRMGARLMSSVFQVYAAIYRPRFVALALDHFAVPDLRDALFAEERDSGAPCPFAGEIRARLRQAIDAGEVYGLGRPSSEDTAAYEAYFGSDEYRTALQGFMAAIEEMNPAWAMIDTGELPPALNFAITREVCDMVRESGSDTIVEAEYGATGQAGVPDAYRSLRGAELARFARQVAGFVKYTGASGISYPIGMEHAAPAGVRHEPDVSRLEVVQREILRTTGRYVPFAQHGGTGAAKVARGLVAKNNVNTYFLVRAAQSLAAHVGRHREGILQGRKSESGTAMYLGASRAVLEATVERLRECGTYGSLFTL